MRFRDSGMVQVDEWSVHVENACGVPGFFPILIGH